MVALRNFITSSPARDRHHLFCDPASGLPMSIRRIAGLIRTVIWKGDPRHAPRAHDVRGVEASLVFLRTHSLDQIKESGQFSTAPCFVTAISPYLLTTFPAMRWDFSRRGRYGRRNVTFSCHQGKQGEKGKVRSILFLQVLYVPISLGLFVQMYMAPIFLSFQLESNEISCVPCSFILLVFLIWCNEWIT